MLGQNLPHPLRLLGDDDAAETRAQPAVDGLKEGGQPPGKVLHRPGLRRNGSVNLDAVQAAPKEGKEDGGQPPAPFRGGEEDEYSLLRLPQG